MALGRHAFSGQSWRWAGLLALSGVLLVGIILPVFRGKNDYGSAAQAGRLNRLLPAEVDGWQVRDEPSGPTEMLKQRAEQLLNYDDYVYRRYFKGGREFTVYVAYWLRGKMPARLVTMHTPDRCWTENGWTCLEATFNEQLRFDRQPGFPPAQRRVFQPPTRHPNVNVRFWLTTSGQPYDFGHRLNIVPSPLKWLGQVVEECFTESGEQLFVRIASNQSFESFDGDPGYEKVMTAVSTLLNSRFLVN